MVSWEFLFWSVSIGGAICYMGGLFTAAIMSSGKTCRLDRENIEMRGRIHDALRQVTPHANATVARMARILRGA